MKYFRIFLLIIIINTQAGSWDSFGPRDSSTMQFFNEALSDMERAFSDNDFSQEDAYYLGRAVAASLLVRYRPYTANPELTQYLNNICMAIAVNSSRPYLFNGYRVVVLDTDEINAFATPGGHIFLTKGLIELTTSEDMLAAVIAHELAHIILDHGLGIVRHLSLSREADTMAARGAGFLGLSHETRQLMIFRDSIIIILDTMLQNGYSQLLEFEADQKAVSLLAATGYNPHSLIDLLVILQQVENSGEGGFNTTHPSPAERIGNLRVIMHRYGTQGTNNARETRFSYIMN